jgi:acetyl esterase/lipase
VPADAPPMFIAAATDDNLGLAPDSIALYQKWTEAHKSAELHMYVKGGHGFGMRKQNIPTDHWIDRFSDWLELNGWLKKPST